MQVTNVPRATRFPAKKARDRGRSRCAAAKPSANRHISIPRDLSARHRVVNVRSARAD